MADGKSPVTKGDFHILNWGLIYKTCDSMVVIGNYPVWKFHTIAYSLELCQFRYTGEEISNVNIKVYYQQIAIHVIVFATCAIFRGVPKGRIKWACFILTQCKARQKFHAC